jgi:hypothetical protein
VNEKMPNSGSWYTEKEKKSVLSLLSVLFSFIFLLFHRDVHKSNGRLKFISIAKCERMFHVGAFFSFPIFPAAGVLPGYVWLASVCNSDISEWRIHFYDYFNA